MKNLFIYVVLGTIMCFTMSCSKETYDVSNTSDTNIGIVGTSWTCEVHRYENASNDKICNYTLEFKDETKVVFSCVSNGIWEGVQRTNYTGSKNWTYTYNKEDKTGVIYDSDYEMPFSVNENQLTVVDGDDTMVFQRQ